MIYLIPFDKLDSEIIVYLKKELSLVFKKQVLDLPAKSIPKDSYNSFRAQYRAEAFLYSLPFDEKNQYLGIVDKDLYVPELNFVFGLAIKGRAVIAIRRLRQEFYGLKPNKNLFLERVLKEAVHELGHAYGLRHCPDPLCVMHFSNSLIDTDKKSSNFCPSCIKMLKRSLSLSDHEE